MPSTRSALSSCECPFPHYLSGGLFLLHPLLRVCPSFAAHSFGCSFNPHQFQFHIYISLPTRTLELVSADESLQVKFNLPPAFINKALLEHSSLIHFCIVYGCFSITTAELSNCARDQMSHEAHNIYYLAFYGKSVPISALDPHCPIKIQYE